MLGSWNVIEQELGTPGERVPINWDVRGQDFFWE